MKYNKIIASMLICASLLVCAACSSSDSSSGESGVSDTDSSSYSQSGSADSSDGSGVTAQPEADPTEDYKASEFVTLGKYKGIPVSVEKVTLTETELRRAIDKIRVKKATTTKAVTNRAVKLWDTVNINYKGLLAGVAFNGGTADDYDLTIGSDSFIPGFEDGVIGAKIGQTVKINLKFPDEYKSSDLAGKAVVFEVTVNKITENVMPQYNNEYVKGISDCKTVAEYEKYMKDKLLKEKNDTVEQQKEEDVWKVVVGNAKVNGYPQSRIDKFTSTMDDYYNSKAAANSMTLEQYFSEGSLTVSNYNVQKVKAAESNILDEMLVKLIAEKEKITVSDKDYSNYRTEYINSLGYSTAEEFAAAYSKDFDEVYTKDAMSLFFLSQKVKEFCADNAIIK